MDKQLIDNNLMYILQRLGKANIVRSVKLLMIRLILTMSPIQCVYPPLIHQIPSSPLIPIFLLLK